MNHLNRSVSFEFLHLPGEAYGHDDGLNRRRSRLDVTVAAHQTLRGAFLEAVFNAPTGTFGIEERACIFEGTLVLELLADDYDPADLTASDRRLAVQYAVETSGEAIRLVTEDQIWSTSIEALWVAVEDGVYPGATRLTVFVGVPGGWGDTGTPGGDPWTDIVVAVLNVGLDQAVGGALGLALTATSAPARRWLAARDARAQARKWRAQGFVSSGDLNEYVDRGEPWDAQLLGRRLALERDQCLRLLRAMGYDERADGRWQPGSGLKHERRRSKWLRRIRWEQQLNSAHLRGLPDFMWRLGILRIRLASRGFRDR